MGPVSTTTVGDATLRVLGDGFGEQTPAGPQIGAYAADGADEIAGQIGATPWRGTRAAIQCVFEDFPD